MILENSAVPGLCVAVLGVIQDLAVLAELQL